VRLSKTARCFRATGLIVATAIVVSAGVAVPAHASPQADLARVRAQVNDLQHVAEAATERYNESKAGMERVQSDLSGLRAKAQRQSAEQQKAAQLVDALARAAYMSGSLDPTLELLLAKDPASFLAQGLATEQLAKSQQSILRRWATSTLRVRQTQAEMSQRLTVVKRLAAAMATAKADADANLNKAQGLLAQLSDAQRQRLASQKAQARKQALAAAAAARQQLATSTKRPGRAPGNSPLGYIGSTRAAAAVRFALSQVGKSYVAAQAGPRSYDCSGLTLAAWRQGGVGLTHYSKAQFSQTRRVPVSQIRPGDLVFYFGSGAHHVAIYVGNGKMVSASNPGDGVELIDFLGPWYRERFSGVGRVL